MESLPMKYSYSVLTFLLQSGEVKKTDLMQVVSNIQSLDKLLQALERDGFIKISFEIKGRRTFLVSLTLLGEKVARHLMRAGEEAASYKSS